MARFVVAVTGGIASGKTAACRSFERLGVAVADADVIARDLVAPGQPALQEIVTRFGAGILTAAGALDRAGLRQIVFTDASARTDLEAILHPRIRAALHASCRSATSAYAIAAIPLLAEGGGRSAYPWIDRILVVDVPRETQVLRLRHRDGLGIEEAERMLAAQASREARLASADDVLENDDGLAMLEAKVAALHARYLRLATEKT